MVIIKRDGQTVTEVATDDDAWIWLLHNQGQSVSYALRFGGYSVTDDQGAERPWCADYRQH